MNEHASPGAHRKVLATLGRDIARHEETLVEMRALQDKLIRVYERSKQSQLIATLQAELALYKQEVL